MTQRGSAQVGASQVGTPQVGVFEHAVAEVGGVAVWPGSFACAESRTDSRSTPRRFAAERSMPRLAFPGRPAQVGAEAGVEQDGLAQFRATQVGAREVGAHQAHPDRSAPAGCINAQLPVSGAVV